jgi:hypothetical protein
MPESKMEQKRDNCSCDDLTDLAVVSARTWVNFLFLHMYRDCLDTYILQRSSGIPDIPTMEDDLPNGELSFDRIINHLKVLTGLDPVQFKEPKHGSVSLLMSGKSVTVDTTFDGSGNDSKCTIEMTTCDA